MTSVTKYLKLVRFAHTVFCLPFALCGFFLGVKSPDGQFTWLLFVQVLLCMVFARNSAMGFNRYLDRDVDAKNPRTENREIPAGKITPQNALLFVVMNILGFISTTYFINKTVFYLSPVAIFVVLFYSYTKRFTSFCHFVLGAGMALAPLGAYLAVTGKWAVLPVLYFFLVLTWGGGFDIIYSLQDSDFDKENGLHSVPEALGTEKALKLSAFMHFLTAIFVFVIGFVQKGGIFFAIGASIFVLLLFRQHRIISKDDLTRVNTAFATFNGTASVLFAVFDIADILL